MAQQLRLVVSIRSGAEGKLMRTSSVREILAEMDKNEAESVHFYNRGTGSSIPEIRLDLEKKPRVQGAVKL